MSEEKDIEMEARDIVRGTHVDWELCEKCGKQLTADERSGRKGQPLPWLCDKCLDA